MLLSKLHIPIAALLWLIAVLPLSAQASPGATRTITDQAGVRVELPARIERVVITSPWPLPSVFSFVDGGSQRLVGIHRASQSSAEHSILARIAPDILRTSTAFIQGTTVNIEELLKLRPDVVLFNVAHAGQRELFERAGIRAVGFSATIKNFNTIETVVSWMDLLGEMLDRRTRAEELKRHANEVLNAVNSRIANIPDARRPRALILFRHSDREIVAAGSNHFGEFWLRSTGAINVASSLRGNQPVNMEQIYAWNPEIIYITDFSPSLPEDFFNNRISGQDWSRVNAVMNRRVYKIPMGHYRWFPPSADVPLMLQWMAMHNHPDLFRDINFEAMLRNYYLRFHNYRLSDEEVKMIMNPPREASDGV